MKAKTFAILVGATAVAPFFVCANLVELEVRNAVLALMGED